MAKIEPADNIKEFPATVIKNMISLATSGFGLVVALAWNELIRASIERYIDPILGKGGGIISLAIYAVVMTLLAVLVTMQLAQIQKRIEAEKETEK
ncbi:MAG: hypothetical protein GF381_03575 [Candidatus Pacebacteria bacterium]|nr:hypothetical protein [Candidatus Paceibacterota bacterium]